jgi:hypothetical protein
LLLVLLPRISPLRPLGAVSIEAFVSSFHSVQMFELLRSIFDEKSSTTSKHHEDVCSCLAGTGPWTQLEPQSENIKGTSISQEILLYAKTKQRQ